MPPLSETCWPLAGRHLWAGHGIEFLQEYRGLAGVRTSLDCSYSAGWQQLGHQYLFIENYILQRNTKTRKRLFLWKLIWKFWKDFMKASFQSVLKDWEEMWFQKISQIRLFPSDCFFSALERRNTNSEYVAYTTRAIWTWYNQEQALTLRKTVNKHNYMYMRVTEKGLFKVLMFICIK